MELPKRERRGRGKEKIRILSPFHMCAWNITTTPTIETCRKILESAFKVESQEP
jgi:hypothetical protein